MEQNTPRARFVAALERQPLTGRVPHFELVFYLTMEAFGKVHPLHRNYGQWWQMEESERRLHRADMADAYIATAERFEHSAIFLHPNPDTLEEALHLIDRVRGRTGDRYFLMMHGDVTYAIPEGGDELVRFCYRLVDEPDAVKDEAALSMSGLLAGNRAGHVFVSENASGPELFLTAIAEGGRQPEALMGDELRVPPGAKVRLLCVVEGARGCGLRIRSGESDADVPIAGDPFRHEWQARIETDTFYRAEVITEPESNEASVRALSNPIYVRVG